MENFNYNTSSDYFDEDFEEVVESYFNDYEATSYLQPGPWSIQSSETDTSTSGTTTWSNNETNTTCDSTTLQSTFEAPPVQYHCQPNASTIVWQNQQQQPQSSSEISKQPSVNYYNNFGNTEEMQFNGSSTFSGSPNSESPFSSANSPLDYGCENCHNEYTPSASNTSSSASSLYSAIDSNSPQNTALMPVHDFTQANYIQQPPQQSQQYPNPPTKPLIPASISMQIAERYRYICTVKGCKKAYTSASHLKLHQNMHTGKYTCGHCGRIFLRQNGLDLHLKGHTGEAPFKCPLCTSAFFRKAILRIHLKHHL